MKIITNFSDIGLNYNNEINSKYTIENITDALYECKDSDIIFVLSPLKSSSREDIIVRSIEKYADKIINYQYPNVEASDFIVAQKGKIKIFVIPHAYDIADITEIDKLIKYVIFSDYIDENVFNNKNYAKILKVEKLIVDEEDKLISSDKKNQLSNKSSIGAIILAAGQGKRCGVNKLLMADKFGEPLFMKSVKAAISSNAKPVFVVTGHNHEEIEEYLKDYDVNIVHNRSYKTGIQSSINAGIRSIPASCDGAILLPADMPNITAQDLNKLISKFDKSKEKMICLFSYKGVKNNPSLWSKSLYSKVQIVPENAHMRTVLMEHNDYIKNIELKDEKKLLDVNYPNQLNEYCQK